MTIKIKDHYFNYDNIEGIKFRYKDPIKGILNGNSIVTVTDRGGNETIIGLDSVTAHSAQMKLETAIINDYILVDLTEE